MSKIFKEMGFLSNPQDVRDKVLPLDKFELFADMDKKEIDPGKLAKLIESAESYLEEEIPFIPLYDYREFKITGNRNHFQSKYYKRRDALSTLSLAEHYEGKGRFASKICDLVWAILEETTWVIHAHASHNPENPKADVPPVYDESTLHGIDLFSAMTAAILVTVLRYNREVLDSLSPLIAERIIYEVKKRAIKPYLNHHFSWSGEYGSKCNNWCPWIVSNILFVTAMLEDNEYNRSSVLLRAMKHLDNYTSWLPDDGGCDEGPGYWGAAGGSLFDACEIIYDMTGGEVDVFSHPHLRLIGEYEAKMNINADRFINFADCSPKMNVNGYLITRFGKRTGSEMLEAFGKMMTKRIPDAIPGNRRSYSMLKDLLMSPYMDAETTKAQKYVWFPGLKVFIARESEDTSKGMFLAIKGGHNHESHNHNDVGHFIIYKNGEPVIIDPGTVQYTRDTFGPKRYTHWAMQSHYHNLPAFDGAGEKNGDEYRSTDEVYDEEKNTISLGLEKAFISNAGIVSYRRSAGITDSVAFVRDDIVLDTEREIDFRLMTHREPTLLECGKLSLAEGVTLSYDKSLEYELEEFDPVGADTNKHWQTPVLYRIHLKCRAKEFHGEMHFI